MPKLTSAEKRHKQSLKRRARNRHIRATVRSTIKEVRKAIALSHSEKTGEALSLAVSVISRAASKGVMHKKTGARKVARLSRAVHKAAASK